MHKSFTFVEILITLFFIGVVFFPVMQLFSSSLIVGEESQAKLIALNLAQSQMEKIRNLKFSKEEWADKSSVYPSLSEPPLVLSGISFRIYTEVERREGPFKVIVRVKKEGEDKPIVVLYTLLEDQLWEKFIPL